LQNVNYNINGIYTYIDRKFRLPKHLKQTFNAQLEFDPKSGRKGGGALRTHTLTHT